MLFLANMASKMNAKSALGSRIAEVHNGCSLFTGDAGQGESNIRRWLIENDWLEAIVALPLNLFYNTGIATYIWVLSNRKPAHRKGQVQLIDASQWFKPLRKNLGKKNCELSPEDIERISRTFLDFKETPESKIFPNAAFGYWKVTVERPLRLHSQLSLKAIETLRFTSGDEELRAALYEEFGDDALHQLRRGRRHAGEAPRRLGQRRGRRRRRRGRQHEEGTPREEEKEAARRQDLGARRPPGRCGHEAARGARRHALRGSQRLPRSRGCRAQGGRDQAPRRRPEADPQSRELARRDRAAGHRQGAQARQGQSRPAARPVHRGDLWERGGGAAIVEYEPDADLRDTEQVPLLEEGGIEAFIRREVLPYTPDAWIKEDATRIGYEVSFTRHFYKPQPLRTLEEISADILAIETRGRGAVGWVADGRGTR